MVPPPREAQAKWFRVTPPISLVSRALKGLSFRGNYDRFIVAYNNYYNTLCVEVAKTIDIYNICIHTYIPIHTIYITGGGYNATLLLYMHVDHH